MREKDIPIFVIDDDRSVRSAVKRLLAAWGFNVETFKSAREFLSSELSRSFGVLILDARMPGMGGLELQRMLTERNPELPVIFISAHDDIQARTAALEGGAVAFLQKPFDERDLVDAVDHALGSDPHKISSRSSPDDTEVSIADPESSEREPGMRPCGQFRDRQTTGL